MAPVDTDQRIWEQLRIDSSASPSTNSSIVPSPTFLDDGSQPRAPVKAPLLNGWRLPESDFPEYSVDKPLYDDPFPIVNQERNSIDQEVLHSCTPPTLVPSPPSPSFRPSSKEGPSTQTAQLSSPLHPSSTPEVSPEPIPQVSPVFRSSFQDGPSPATEAFPEASPVEQSFRERGTSISFDPKVTLDCGQKKALEAPLPKPRRSGPANATLGGRLMLQQLSDLHGSGPFGGLHRTQSESFRTIYDEKTGQLLPPRATGRRHARDNARLHTGEARHPLLQSTVDAMARDPEVDHHQRMASLTSGCVASPSLEEVPPPLDSPVEFTLSPLSKTSLLQPTSLEESSAWPITRPLHASHRTKSYTIDRPGGAYRRARETPSRRSSQAASFLSTWGQKSAASAEPDDEGQEVCDYVLGRQIGFGGFSVVKEAYRLSDTGEQTTHAVKVVRKHIRGKSEQENEQAQAEFEHEVSVWRILSHRHILRLKAVYDTPFATYCFMPLNVGGSLYDLMRMERKGLPAHLVKRYASQLASAMRYLHEDVRIAHRDIKLENCLLDRSDPESAAEGGNILLCDFGMAEYIVHPHRDSGLFDRSESPESFGMRREHDGRTSVAPSIGPSHTSTSIDGSLQYASPELIMGPSSVHAGSHAAAADMWAYGVMLYTLCVGRLPFQHTFLPRLQMMILKGDWDETALRDSRAIRESGDGVAAMDVVRGCLEMDVEVRWDVGRLMGSRWFEDCPGMGVEDGGPVRGGWSGL
ncbi:MAG: hypothetical protein M1817_005742 [Caeruleum heppii]|nr:MAG: hypothetical protein M1817_005742 [Caeruleum heppii]